MFARALICLAVFALGSLLFSAGAAWATPQSDLPVMPFDQMTKTDGDFANFSTPSTPVEPDVPTTGAGPIDDMVENSPEPATLTLLGVGGVGAWLRFRRRKAA